MIHRGKQISGHIKALFLAALPVFLAAGDAGPNAALRDPKAPFWSQAAPDVFKVRIHSTAGDFVVEAHRDWAPHGADRFYNLTRAGFFDDSRFFRVDPHYIAQFGIPGDPAISAIWQNEYIPADPPGQSNQRGTIGFAMVSPDKRTTQLYINLTDNKRNDPDGFAILGKIVEGMDVVDKLYSGYGEKSGGGMRAGKQQRLFAEGNAWLDHDFPKLDKLLSATLIPPAAH